MARHPAPLPRFLPTAALLCSVLCGWSEEPPKTHVITFANDVAPLLEKYCVSCHSESLELGDLRLDRREYALDDNLIKPGHAADSLFIQRLSNSKAGIRMPPTGSQLNADEMKILTSWIDQGADWPEDHLLASAPPSPPQNPAASSLFQAIRNADAKELQSLLGSNPKLTESRNRDGYSPLLLAAYCSSTQCLKVLIDAGADLEAKSPQGLTPLMLSAGSPAKTRSLLAAGANPNARGNNGRTALHQAVTIGNSRTVANALLDSGAQIDQTDNQGLTPLSHAVNQGQSQMIPFLIRHGADPGKVKPHHISDNLPAIRSLADDHFYEDKGAVRTALFEAVTMGDNNLVQSLLHRGADPDPNGRYRSGFSLLIRAAYSEFASVDLLRTLVRQGADPSLKDDGQRSALDWARLKGNSPTVRYLESLQPGSPPATDPNPTNTNSAGANTGSAPVPNTESLDHAAERGIRLLQRSNLRFFQRSGCLACHQQPTTSIATGMARKRGLAFREDAADQQTKLYSVLLEASRRRYMNGNALGGNQDNTGFLLFGLGAEGYPRTNATDAMVIQLAGRQRDDGAWPTSGHRPPAEYSRITTTAFAVAALNAYAPPGLKPEMKRRINAARKWFLASTPQTLQEKAAHLLGLAWSGANRASLRKARQTLLNEQRDNGGWAQLPSLEADAYATGLALYALREGADLSPQHPAYQDGTAFLLRTQLEDGSWHVKGRTLKFQPYFESGFPHGHDQWISAQATGWAAIALMQHRPPEN